MDSQDSMTSVPSGPTPQTGTSASQPLVNEAQTLLSRLKRTISERAQNDLPISKLVGGQLPEKYFASLEELRKEVMKIIIGRLNANGVQSTMLKPSMLSWCLPSRSVTQSRRGLFILTQ